MKKATTFLLFSLLIALSLPAQAPQLFQYQAVARNAQGQPLSDQPVSLRMSVVPHIPDGPAVYTEVHAAQTNALGLFQLAVGNGAPVLGSFSTINWQEGPYYLRVELDPDGGSDDHLLGAQQLLAVPYALHAGTVDNADDADADPTNELQFLNLQGNQLSIGPSGSSTVTLPSGGGSSFWLPAGNDIYYDAGNVFVDRSLVVGQDVLVQNLDDPDGLIGAEMITYSDGEGRVLTYGANGSTNAAFLSTDNFNDGGLSLFDQNSNERFAAGINTVNAGVLELYGPNGNSNLVLSSATSNTNHGWLGLQDFDGYTQVLLTVLDDTGEGYLETVGPNGQPNVQLASSAGNANHGYLAVSEAGGYEAASLSVAGSGQGLVAAVGANGYDNVLLTNVAGRPNQGYLAVLDEAGDIRTGAFVNNFGDGVLFGDIKNFRMPHPEKNDKEIWYASLEGPEAAAYVRGTAQLNGGETFVAFPEHFRHVANPATMTVMLTPLSADTRGLAVVEKTATGFRVQELMGGTGHFGFDWEVKCVRKGYEDYQVERDRSETAAPTHPRSRLPSRRADRAATGPPEKREAENVNRKAPERRQ